MCDKSCYFEPTDTLNGIPISSGGCQALTRLRIGREGKCADCGHPPSAARSQEAGTGILGKQKKSSPNGLLFFFGNNQGEETCEGYLDAEKIPGSVETVVDCRMCLFLCVADPEG